MRLSVAQIPCGKPIAWAALLALLGSVVACGGGSGAAPESQLGQGTGQNTGPAVRATVADSTVASIGTSLAEDRCSINYTVSAYLGAPAEAADPLLNDQWHLVNTGQAAGFIAGEDINVKGAWSITKGAGVRVAVVDRGVELTHEDLAANVVTGGSFNYFTEGVWPLPCNQSDSQSHGTWVAGLILARDANGLGGIGVAPRASLVAFNPLDSTDANLASALIRDANLNHIFNNSWGSNDNGFLHAAEASFEAAINHGLSNGRAGKGSIYVFPAGNGQTVSLPNGASTSENSNYDGYVNKLGIITTCAVNASGKQTYFSESGANLLVCAPGDAGFGARGVTTTAPLNNYFSGFAGTSASVPMVSGVAALMLAANPELTWRDVRLILAQTARKNDPGDSDWHTGADYHFNHKYGFGVVDASAAVDRARTWISVGGSSTLARCDGVSQQSNRAIPDAGPGNTPGFTLVDTIELTQQCHLSSIEFIEVTVSTQHAYAADLQIQLRSPAGTVSRLAETRTCDRARLGSAPNPCAANFPAWRFGSNRHLGESSLGTWNLEITDRLTEDSGSLVGWSITVWGRP